MPERDAIYIGIRGTVLALDSSTGAEIWKAELKGASFVNVTFQDGKILAATKGELFCLDAATGTTRWKNELKGLGLGFVTIAGSAQTPAMAALHQQQSDGAAAAAAAGAAAG